jgi:drug/metabolite transporter (DMT)-like permease
VLAASFAGESLGAWQIVGMALVLSQSVVIQLPEPGERGREARA